MSKIRNLIDILKVLNVEQNAGAGVLTRQPPEDTFLHSILLLIDVRYRNIKKKAQEKYRNDLKLYMANNIERVSKYITRIYNKDKTFKKHDIKNIFLNRGPLDPNIILRHCVIEFFKINVLVYSKNNPIDYYIAHDSYDEQTLQKCTVLLHYDHVRGTYSPKFRTPLAYGDNIYYGYEDLRDVYIMSTDACAFRNYDYHLEYLTNMYSMLFEHTAPSEASRDDIIDAIRRRI